jgi:hypothetical protein
MTEPKKQSHLLEDLLEQYLRFDALGLKLKTTQAVLSLVDAVSCMEAKVSWTRDNLDRLPLNRQGRIRHEIFENIIFPGLLDGFKNGDSEASYLLGSYAQNLYANPSIFEQVSERSALDFFRIAFQYDTSSARYQHAYLSSIIKDLEYVFHEWPAGILIDPSNFSDALFELKGELSIALSLDRDKQYTTQLVEWREATEQYELRRAERKDSR